MAPRSSRPSAQGLVTFKDVAVDFTPEEWDRLEQPQKDLYKGVMLENAQILLSLGLPVPREDVTTYMEQRDIPWMLEEEGLRSCCPGEIEPKIKEIPAEISPFVEDAHKQRNINDGLCDLIWREICAIHQRTCTGENAYDCNDCRKTFTVKSNLILHQRIHNGEKPYECNECEKAFNQKSHLAVHHRIHSGEKPYECNECGKTFTASSNLVVHQRIHSGENLYECNECGKTLRVKPSLFMHQRIHIGEKPYECNECGKTFTVKSSLFMHQRIHSRAKPYECNECGKIFTMKSNLVMHQRIHSGEKPYECNECGKTFTYSSNLAKHQRIHSFLPPFSYHELLPDAALAATSLSLSPMFGKGARPEPTLLPSLAPASPKPWLKCALPPCATSMMTSTVQSVSRCSRPQ